MKTPVHSNEQYRITGGDIGMPLIELCGYNDFTEASGLGWHVHNGYELLFLLEGSACYEFEDATRAEISGGEFFAALPHQRHHALHDVNSPSKLCWITFDLDIENALQNTVMDQADRDLIAACCRLKPWTARPYSSSIRTLLTLFRDAVKAHHSQPSSPFQAARLRSLICQILIESAECLAQRLIVKTEDCIVAVKEIMEKGFADDLKIDEIADTLGISRGWLHRTFKISTGLTPLDYLQRLRIKQAQHLLATGLSNVTDIALDSAFNSSQHFSKVFRKYTGQTPIEYRKWHSEKDKPTA